MIQVDWCSRCVHCNLTKRQHLYRVLSFEATETVYVIVSDKTINEKTDYFPYGFSRSATKIFIHLSMVILCFVRLYQFSKTLYRVIVSDAKMCDSRLFCVVFKPQLLDSCVVTYPLCSDCIRSKLRLHAYCGVSSIFDSLSKIRYKKSTISPCLPCITLPIV